ncbi:hypothetical protein EGI22_17790 [Lacihabitans sp. LS3-19]|uniref:hypothetical protein n=1 Tax=Lacihabitans sp. LS3-19 TaxID=2487335 RepID=UPI0020CF0BAD|nr:hypothetical protein [Lacihabitans sp. LS3-19]MCP9769760.1 hypothetical protein [Lacihabitans sp. LS3-19]
MKKTLLILLTSFCSAFSQSAPYQFVIENVTTAATGSRIEVRGKDTVLVSKYNNTSLKQSVQNELEFVYQGTPYFQNGWYKGRVILTDNANAAYGVIAYDLVKNMVLFTYANDKEAVEIKPFEFEINGHVFKKVNNQYAAAGNIYYEKLVEGETELFCQYVCDYVGKTSDGVITGYEANGDGYEGHFKKKVYYYINFHEKMQRVGKNFKIFGQDEEIAKAYAKKNKLSLKEPGELIEIVRYINSKNGI